MAANKLHHGHRPRLTYAEFAPHTRRYRRTLSPYTPRTPIREGIRAATVASARAACGGVRSECATAIALRACGAGQNAFLGPRAGWCGLRSAWRRSRSEPRADGCANTGGGRFVNLWFVYDVLIFDLAMVSVGDSHSPVTRTRCPRGRTPARSCRAYGRHKKWTSGATTSVGSALLRWDNVCLP